MATRLTKQVAGKAFKAARIPKQYWAPNGRIKGMSDAFSGYAFASVQELIDAGLHPLSIAVRWEQYSGWDRSEEMAQRMKSVLSDLGARLEEVSISGKPHFLVAQELPVAEFDYRRIRTTKPSAAVAIYRNQLTIDRQKVSNWEARKLVERGHALPCAAMENAL
jgi:hypothetical protein